MITLQSQPEVRLEDILFTDTETFSEEDIKEVGGIKYAENAELMLAGFRLGDRYQVWDFTENEPIPTWVMDHINKGGLVCAQNAIFDFVVLKQHIHTLTLEQMRDTMAQLAMCGLPLNLEKAGKALGLPENQQKNKEGKRLIRKFCIPRSPSKYNSSTRIMPQDDPEDWDVFKNEYLRDDIISMIEIYKLLPPLSDYEQAVWVDTQTVNLSGVPVDREMCEHIIERLDKLVDDESSRFIRLTGIFPTQRAKVLAWVNDQGVRCPNMQAATVQTIIGNPDVPQIVREALEARANTTHMSFSKFPKMLATCCEDGTVKGSLMYHVAGTGRFGGRLIQTQNLTKGNIETNEAVMRIRNGEFSVELVKSAVRGMIYTPEGMSIADYKGIEARIVQWICQDFVALEIFSSGQDPYIWMASKIYGVPYDQVTDKQRFTGKQAILGLGFQMSWKKFIMMVESYGETITEDEAKIAVKIYRDTHTKLVRFWNQINKGATMALQTPGKAFKVNKYISFAYDGEQFLMMYLPSGRTLYYYMPQLEVGAYDQLSFSYMSMNEKHQYVRTHTYGGKLTENAVQATARDLLVEGISKILDNDYRIITHVHDEVVVAGMGNLDHVMELMCDLPEWAEGIPLEAEGFTSMRFKKG